MRYACSSGVRCCRCMWMEHSMSVVFFCSGPNVEVVLGCFYGYRYITTIPASKITHAPSALYTTSILCDSVNKDIKLDHEDLGALCKACSTLNNACDLPTRPPLLAQKAGSRLAMDNPRSRLNARFVGWFETREGGGGGGRGGIGLYGRLSRTFIAMRNKVVRQRARRNRPRIP